jgi:hypothetical protein
MSTYLKSLAELAVTGFFAGGAADIATSGFELSQNGVSGLLAAAGLSAYGLVVKNLADRHRASAVPSEPEGNGVYSTGTVR